jgi:hypothetical protein
MEAAFVEERGFVVRAMLEQDVACDAALEAVRHGPLDAHGGCVAGKSPLRRAEALGVVDDGLADRFEQFDVHSKRSDLREETGQVNEHERCARARGKGLGQASKALLVQEFYGEAFGHRFSEKDLLQKGTTQARISSRRCNTS